MQITVYTRPEYLDEISKFLISEIPYEHSIPIYTKSTLTLLSFPYVEVSLFYDDYVRLIDFKMENTEQKTQGLYNNITTKIK